MTEMSNALRFMKLFKGYSQSHGTYNPSGLGGEGKQKPQYLTKKTPTTLQNFDEHVTGKQPIGIYPLDDNDRVSFAAIDIDRYPIDQADISNKLQNLKIPLVVCNSKSNGAHIYAFFHEPEGPEIAISLLKRVSAYLGHPEAEIFPKQIKRPSGGYGSFINLPFFGHPSLSYSCWNGDKKLGLDGFLDLAESRLTSVLELEELINEAGLPEVSLSSEPRAEEAISASGRNDYLFRFGCELFRLIKDEATLLEQLKKKNLSATAEEHQNFEACGPLEASEVSRICQSIISSADRSSSSNAAHLISELNQCHAHVMVGGKARILNIKKDPLQGWNVHDFSTTGDFRSLYANRRVIIGNKSRNAAEIWLKHPERLSYDGVTFDPTGKSNGYYNLYQGFPLKAAKGDCGLYLEHIRQNICRGDEDLYEYVLDWMADAIQNPGKRPGVALAIRGKQGVGKGVFVNVFASLFGPHAIQVTQSSHLVGNFNAHLRDKLLVFADEAFWAGDKRAEGVLKGLVTEDNIAIEMKGIDVQSSPNYVRLILASNNEWIIPASADQRRFVVIEASEARIQDASYFGSIINQIENGGREALMYFLSERDLNGVNLRNIPKTEALVMQQLHILDSVAQWLYNCLYSGEIEDDGHGNRTSWPTSMSVSNFYDAYINFCKRHSISHPSKLVAFGRRLRELLPTSRKTREGGKTREAKYQLPDIEKAKLEFTTANGWRDFQWEDEGSVLL